MNEAHPAAPVIADSGVARKRDGRNAGSVLLVEDDPGSSDLISDLLESAGFEVKAVATGLETRAHLQSARPDLIILDLRLPDVDGLVLCHEIRRRCTTPIIVCSGSIRKFDPILALKLGADDFNVKPFDIYEFEARVEAVLRRVQASLRRKAVPSRG